MKRSSERWNASVVYLESSASFICHCSFYLLRYSTILSLLPFLSFSFNTPFCFITNKMKAILTWEKFHSLLGYFFFQRLMLPFCSSLLLFASSSLFFVAFSHNFLHAKLLLLYDFSNQYQFDFLFKFSYSLFTCFSQFSSTFRFLFVEYFTLK